MGEFGSCGYSRPEGAAFILMEWTFRPEANLKHAPIDMPIPQRPPSLRAIIKENFASLDSDMVVRACGRFRGRVEAVIGAGGDFIE